MKFFIATILSILAGAACASFSTPFAIAFEVIAFICGMAAFWFMLFEQN